MPHLALFLILSKVENLASSFVNSVVSLAQLLSLCVALLAELVLYKSIKHHKKEYEKYNYVENRNYSYVACLKV